MKIIKSNEIKNDILKNIEYCNKKKSLLIISQNNDLAVNQYKNAIIRRCNEFNIDYIDKEFSKEDNHLDIINYCNNLNNIDGFIVLQPLLESTDLDYLRENIPFNDLDGFKYDSLGKIMNKKFENLPQTVKSIIKFINYMNLDLEGKDIIIANSTNVIGKPLAMYLNYKKASVTLFNSKTKNQKEKIKNCDIFISAIGKANYYNKDYFRNGQIIIDAGVSFVDGNMYGDVDYEDIKDLDIKIVTCKNGVGSITTLSLLESLLYS